MIVNLNKHDNIPLSQNTKNDYQTKNNIET